MQNLDTSITSTQEKTQEYSQVSEQSRDIPRDTSISIDNLVRITNSKVVAKQIGIVTKVTAGRIFFRFHNTSRYTRRACYNVKRVSQA